MPVARFPTIGETAPSFQLECVDGVHDAVRHARLSDYAGRWLILIFYPRDFSFVCPTELTAFSAYQADFQQRDCDLLGISVDTLGSHREWLRRPLDEGGIGQLQFPLASDVSGTVSRAYGVWMARKEVATRGLFMIDPDSVLQYAVVHNLNVGRGPDEVLRVLDGLRQGGLCPSSWTTADGLIDPQDALQPGRVLGHYRISTLLGSGTFGTVFAAWDMRLERMVALKVLKRTVIESRDFLLREARTAARLNHPNVCTIYAVEEEDGLPVIAMEYIDGQLLRTLIERGMSGAQVLAYAHQIALGLTSAHRQNVVHGDFKPANIIVDEAGQVKILDFGLARSQRLGATSSSSEKPPTKEVAADAIDKAGDALAATVDFGHSLSTGSLSFSGSNWRIRGTPAYMSPEQAIGRRTIPASDVFSFGLTLYEMLTGRRALAVDSYGDLIARLSDERFADELCNHVERPFRGVLGATLALAEKHRPAMQQVADDLSQLIRQLS